MIAYFAMNRTSENNICNEHTFCRDKIDGHRWCVICDACEDGEEGITRRGAKYTGPNNSGICVCGCPWDEHHLGVVVRLGCLLTDQGTREFYIPQECEYYGCNEYGGRKYNEVTEEWEDHCHSYKDRGY